MSLTNDELEQQLLQLADALAKMSEMTATAFEDRDKHIQALQEKIVSSKILPEIMGSDHAPITLEMSL